MGLAIALMFSTLLCAVAYVTTPRVIAYAFLVILAFFEEMGPGFTVSTGSIFFQPEFVKFANARFFEILVVMCYPVVLLRSAGKPKPYLRFEKKLAIAFLLLLLPMLLTEYWLHGRVTVWGWRPIVIGMMMFHMIAMLIDSETQLLKYIKAMVVLLSAKALFALLLFLSGHGVDSPRGSVPFYWDTRFIATFCLSAILLTAYLLQRIKINPSYRIFTKAFAITLIIILFLTVTMSFRRTEWFILYGGVGFLLFKSGQAKVQHIIFALFSIALTVIIIIAVPALEKTQERLEYYINSMNLFSDDVASQQQNATHIDNVFQYMRIISEEPQILLAGFRSRTVADYAAFEAERDSNYDFLGQAHNSILKSLQIFGAPGLLIYLLLYIHPFSKYKQISLLPDSSPMKFIALGALTYLFFRFIPPLFFAPPFYTTIKGVFFTFLSVFMFRAAVYHGGNEASAPVTGHTDTETPPNGILRARRKAAFPGSQQV